MSLSQPTKQFKEHIWDRLAIMNKIAAISCYKGLTMPHHSLAEITLQPDRVMQIAWQDREVALQDCPLVGIFLCSNEK